MTYAKSISLTEETNHVGNCTQTYIHVAILQQLFFFVLLSQIITDTSSTIVQIELNNIEILQMPADVQYRLIA